MRCRLSEWRSTEVLEFGGGVELLEEAEAADQEVVRLDLALLGSDEAFQVVVVVHIEDLGREIGT